MLAALLGYADWMNSKRRDMAVLSEQARILHGDKSAARTLLGRMEVFLGEMARSGAAKGGRLRVAVKAFEGRLSQVLSPDLRGFVSQVDLATLRALRQNVGELNNAMLEWSRVVAAFPALSKSVIRSRRSLSTTIDSLVSALATLLASMDRLDASDDPA